MRALLGMGVCVALSGCVAIPGSVVQPNVLATMSIFASAISPTNAIRQSTMTMPGGKTAFVYGIAR